MYQFNYKQYYNRQKGKNLSVYPNSILIDCPFFSSTAFSRGVNCFKALRISVRSCATSGQTFLIFLFNLFEFPKGNSTLWLNRSSYTFYLILFQKW